ITNNKPKTNGGTTFTAALVLDQTLYIAHVGDSRAYWLVDDKFEAITVDHSLVQRLQDTGQLTEKEAERYQYRNVLLRALGQEEALVVDTYQRELPARGKLLLCSDGLCGFVSDQSLEFYMSQSNSTQHIADKLHDTAMATGGHDNITAVVVEFSL
ncbi:MAG: serine/threonine-protein phosphatase, partial [Methylococcales bacterium]|nr:serine/threonine-protein phosphatase [Methylococcales bacterium]